MGLGLWPKKDGKKWGGERKSGGVGARNVWALGIMGRTGPNEGFEQIVRVHVLCIQSLGFTFFVLTVPLLSSSFSSSFSNPMSN